MSQSDVIKHPLNPLTPNSDLALIRGFHSTKIHSQAFSVVMGEATPSFLVAAAGLYKEWQDSVVEVIIFRGEVMSKMITPPKVPASF